MAKPNRHDIHSETVIHNGVHEQGGLGTAVRLFWALFGNIVIVLLAIAIYRRHSAVLQVGWLDLAYLIIVFGLIAMRYLDIKFLGGLTGQGTPASMADWRKYALYVLLISLGLWLAARIAGSIFI